MFASSDDLDLTEVGDGVWQLRLPIPWEDGHVNCFLLTEGGHVDMIDCGMRSDDSLALIWAAVERVGGPGARMRRLVVTHIHPDHYGGAGEITSRTGAELYLHRLEVPMVHPRYLEIDQLVEEVGRYLGIHGVPEQEADFLKNASTWIREFVKPAEPALQLDGTEMLQIGSRRLRVEWTPGHSPGHVCLYDADDGLLFAGDQLLPDASPNIGLHPQSTPNPLDDYVTGLRRIEELRPRLVLPAHGAPFTAVSERVAYLLNHHRRRKEQMLEVLSRGEMNGWQVAVAVWGLRPNLHEMRMALQEGLAHLQSLSRQGRLEKLATPSAITWRRPT
ncbi:MBL fold metallo-hydrolase [Candidatus Nephthysia bennettiae]|uniref:MBL fold metallo-hydrolase n=1 Tax=Candidatus Nephthysia bennettiae TaxID=3127016 RepID=A0A934K6K5_9BACT|nr:MBL fold metallo-hydrolase [Candidatus Dormibacteraeota bacterium]MBJ7611805.1 MBL fold metallo-hydrolase [Candidatus Dormibacteraeota bacterium]